MADRPLLPVLVDVYNWSEGYLPVGTFELGMLAVMSRYIVVEEYDVGEVRFFFFFRWQLQHPGLNRFLRSERVSQLQRHLTCAVYHALN